MATKPIGQPRFIDPALVEIGDDISVESRPVRGAKVTTRGIVGKRVDGGETRYMMTAEGYTLFAWEPHGNAGIKITLYGREEKPQESIFDLSDIEKRYAL